MGRFIVVVLDGFGIGEMEDTKLVRIKDICSHTNLYINVRSSFIHNHKNSLDFI